MLPEATVRVIEVWADNKHLAQEQVEHVRREVVRGQRLEHPKHRDWLGINGGRPAQASVRSRAAMHSRFHCKILSIAPKSSQERGETRAKVKMFEQGASREDTFDAFKLQ